MTRRGALLLVLLSSLTGPAYADDDRRDQLRADEPEKEGENAQPATDRQGTPARTRHDHTLTQQKREALERNSQPGVDPWSASSSTALFTRPSVYEVLKLALDTQGVFGVSLAPVEAINGEQWLLRAFRISAGWNHEDRVSSGGLAWSVSLRDTRFIPDGDFQKIHTLAMEDEPCHADGSNRRACGESYQNNINQSEALERYWWPAFSLGGSVEYDHANRQRGGIKVNASIDVQGEYGIAITANADFTSEPVENMAGVYTRRAGGGLALSVRPSWKWVPSWKGLRDKSIVMAGTKYLYCRRQCMDQKSPWELNVVAGYEIKKGTLFGVSVVWKDEDLRDRELVLNLSTSFGTLE